MEMEKEMMERARRRKRKENKKKRGLLILLLLLLLLLIGIGAAIFIQFNRDSKKDRLARDEMALGGMLPGKTPQEISDILNAKVEEGMVDITISAGPIFEENGKKGRIGIENIEANRYSFKVTLRLDETGEVLYESGLIDPGYYVEFIELNKTLPAGNHDATATFEAYSLDETEDRISATNVKLILYVLDGKYYQ